MFCLVEPLIFIFVVIFNSLNSTVMLNSSISRSEIIMWKTEIVKLFVKNKLN